MSKYIIRNCPCFVEGIAIKGNEQKTQTCNNHKVRELTLCKDCTDCKIKQVIEKCRKEVICDDCELQGTTRCDARMCTNFYLNDFAEEVLQLFNIEECE